MHTCWTVAKTFFLLLFKKSFFCCPTSILQSASISVMNEKCTQTEQIKSEITENDDWFGREGGVKVI